MGILEIHFHDSRFEWTINPGTDDERSLSFGVGSESERARGDRSESGPSAASKLRSFGVVALVVGAAVALDRMQSRHARQTRESQAESTGSRLSPFLSK